MINTLIILPLYNGLVGIMDIIPGIDVGMAVIVFTVVVRLILFPLSKSALLTQVRMKDIEPEANRIKAQYTNDKQLQAAKVMELYKEKKVKPFSSVLLLLIQMPILLGLISVFYKIIPTIHPDMLYSFIALPVVKPTLLGLSLTSKSVILSLITAVLQFLQLQYSLAARQQKESAEKTLKAGGQLDKASQISNSMTTQMKFFVPFITFASVYWLIPSHYPQAASVIAIYLSVSAIFTLAQELYIKRKHLDVMVRPGQATK